MDGLESTARDGVVEPNAFLWVTSILWFALGTTTLPLLAAIGVAGTTSIFGRPRRFVPPALRPKPE